MGQLMEERVPPYHAMWHSPGKGQYSPVEMYSIFAVTTLLCMFAESGELPFLMPAQNPTLHHCDYFMFAM